MQLENTKRNDWLCMAALQADLWVKPQNQPVYKLKLSSQAFGECTYNNYGGEEPDCLKRLKKSML